MKLNYITKGVKMAKIWVASHDVFSNILWLDINTKKQHAFYIYDPDGDPISGDELIFRGGPKRGDDIGRGNIVIENWVPVAESADNYFDREGLPVCDIKSFYNITDTFLLDQDAEDFKDAVEKWAKQFGNPCDDGRIQTDIKYTIPYPDDLHDTIAALDDLWSDNDNFRDNDISAANNSNTVFFEAGKAGGLDIFNNLPRRDGTGERLDIHEFPGHESYIGKGDGTVVFDKSDDRHFTSSGGNTTYKYYFDSTEANNNTITINEDSDAETIDVLQLSGLSIDQVQLERVCDDVHIYLPGDVTEPSFIIANQFGCDAPKVHGIEVDSGSEEDMQFISLANEEEIKQQSFDFLPDWL